MLHYMIENLLSYSIGEEYARRLAQDEAFFEAVYDDIKTSSDYSKNGEVSTADIKLAIGRVILKKFGIIVRIEEGKDITSLLRRFLQAEVKFRLKEWFGLPEEKITDRLVYFIVERLLNDSDIFNFDYVDGIIYKMLKKSEVHYYVGCCD